MLKDIAALTTKRIEVADANVTVAITDDALAPLYLTLPPVEELKAIRNLADLQLSANDVVVDARERIHEHFLVEHGQLAQKSEKFDHSVTYLNHLANLAELAGETVLAERYLRSAVTLSNERFLAHRLQANLLRQRNLRDLEAITSGPEQEEDYDTCLYLAYSAVLRRDYNGAFALVARALEIDPIDSRGRMLAGALCLYQSEYERAIQNFRIAAEEKSNSSALFVNLAVAHFCLGDSAKALTMARRAVSINPMDRNAVAFYADIAFHEHRSGEAIPSLEKFTRYEQKIPAIWSRLARAHFLENRLSDALGALKQEAAIQESPSVWNNIGVVYARMGDSRKALQYYNYAIQGEAYHSDDAAALALSNLLLLLGDGGHDSEVLGIASPLIRGRLRVDAIGKRQFVGAYLAYLRALTRLGKTDEALRVADAWIGSAETSAQLRVAILAHMLFHYSIVAPERDRAVHYARWAFESLGSCNECDPAERAMLINNIAFTFIEFGQTDGVARVLPMLTRALHSEPFSTATLGLYHLRKNHLERGQMLYREAIALATDHRAKEIIRQKMNLELGRAYLKQGNTPVGRKFLEKAAKKGGLALPMLCEQATALLRPERGTH